MFQPVLSSYTEAIRAIGSLGPGVGPCGLLVRAESASSRRAWGPELGLEIE